MSNWCEAASDLVLFGFAVNQWRLFMAHYEHLPIWAYAMKLSAGIERAVASVSHHNNYALGAESRRSAMKLQGIVVRAARPSAHRCQLNG